MASAASSRYREAATRARTTRPKFWACNLCNLDARHRNEHSSERLVDEPFKMVPGSNAVHVWFASAWC